MILLPIVAVCAAEMAASLLLLSVVVKWPSSPWSDEIEAWRGVRCGIDDCSHSVVLDSVIVNLLVCLHVYIFSNLKKSCLQGLTLQWQKIKTRHIKVACLIKNWQGLIHHRNGLLSKLTITKIHFCCVHLFVITFTALDLFVKTAGKCILTNHWMSFRWKTEQACVGQKRHTVFYVLNWMTCFPKTENSV